MQYGMEGIFSIMIHKYTAVKMYRQLLLYIYFFFLFTNLNKIEKIKINVTLYIIYT